MFMNWYIVLILFSISCLKFMFVCIWKRMREMNDKLIARIILRWAIFISIWFPLTAPINKASSFGNQFCLGIYNDHNQIMNSDIPDENLPLPYAPLLIFFYVSIIILTVAIWFRQFKNSAVVINPLNLAVAPLSANSPSPFVQRPKDMESLLANFSLLILVAINSIGTLVWRKYENYIIVRFSHFFIHDNFFLVCSLMKWQCTQTG